MSEEPKVVSLRGHPIPAIGEPNEKMIRELERLLEAARSGDLQGVVVAMLHKDDTTQSMRCGVMSRGLIGLVSTLHHDMCHDFNSN